MGGKDIDQSYKINYYRLCWFQSHINESIRTELYSWVINNEMEMCDKKLIELSAVVIEFRSSFNKLGLNQTALTINGIPMSVQS